MHPYAGHRQKTVEKRRVKVVMRSGGYAHSDEAADKKLFKKMISQHEREEGRHGGEYAQGGRIDKAARGGKITPNKHRPHVSVNIHHHSRPAAPLPLAGGPGAAAALPIPPAPAGGGQLPPSALKRGGRAEYISGVSTGENLKQWKGYANKGTVKYARGGPVLHKFPELAKPGAHSEQRLDTAKRAWADRVGGSKRTTQLNSGMKHKRFGATTGMGNLEEAVALKRSHP